MHSTVFPGPLGAKPRISIHRGLQNVAPRHPAWVGKQPPHCSKPTCQRAKGSSHNAAIRALAFKWIRILWRCWTDRQPYDETRYLLTLQKRHSPVVALAATSS